MYVYVYVCVHIYIYIYIHLVREAPVAPVLDLQDLDGHVVPVPEGAFVHNVTLRTQTYVYTFLTYISIYLSIYISLSI